MNKSVTENSTHSGTFEELPTEKMGFKNKTKVMLNLPMLCVFLMLRVLLKGRLAYKQRAEKFETNSLQSMIRSH